MEFYTDRDRDGTVSEGDGIVTDSTLAVCDGKARLQGIQGLKGDQGIQGDGTCNLEPVTGGVKVHCGENEYVLANPGTTIVVSPVTATAQAGASPDVSTIPSGEIYWEDANGQLVNVWGQLGPSVQVGTTQYPLDWDAERGFFFYPLYAQFVSDDCTGVPLKQYYFDSQIFKANPKYFILDRNISLEGHVLTKSYVSYGWDA
jgi:hypothetical protein